MPKVCSSSRSRSPCEISQEAVSPVLKVALLSNSASWSRRVYVISVVSHDHANFTASSAFSASSSSSASAAGSASVSAAGSFVKRRTVAVRTALFSIGLFRSPVPVTCQ